ncbi:hydantoinase/oxoprolinase family protein [Desulfobacula sp.]
MIFKIGIDVGGTFTDFLLLDNEGNSEIFKVLSSPEDPSIAVMSGLNQMAEKVGISLSSFFDKIEIIVHGTTVTTNAVLTGNVARTGLFTTKGFRDALQMRRGIREELYNNKYLQPDPIVPRHLRLPVRERVDYAGNIVTEIDENDVIEGTKYFISNDIEAVAVCFMHSYTNNSHERKAEEIIRKYMPDAYLSVSSSVLPQIRFYDRVSTTVLNASVGPILKNYLSRLTKRLLEKGFSGIFLIMQSNGGVTTPEIVTELAATTLLSGPAAAPMAGMAYAELHGQKSFLTVDMGGTSFDAALIKDAKPIVTMDGKVDRMALALPMMDIKTIGAGGGSIAWIDEGGLLRMGPKSSGARPGPVCYDLGGKEPCCSDANLILGYLDPDFFAGGKIKLNKAAAEEAIKRTVADPLKMDLIEAAYGMYHIMNVNMASAIREISVQRGFDPRDFLLICGGGAGPMHAAMISVELDISKILIPKESSILCAAGMLLSDLKHDFVRSFHTLFPLEQDKQQQFSSLITDLKSSGETILSNELISEEKCKFQFSLDLRYIGQYHEVCVPVEFDDIMSMKFEKMANSFHAEHNRLYGYDLKDEETGMELVNIRMTALGITDKPAFQKEVFAGKEAFEALKGQRPVFIPSKMDFASVNIYDGDKMSYGNTVKGPAIIEQKNTTIFVPSMFEIECDQYGSFMMTKM